MEAAQTPEITAEMLQQNPVLLSALVLVFCLMLIFVAGGIASWIFFGVRPGKGQPLWPQEPWRPRLWSLTDVLLIALGIILLFPSLFLYIGSSVPNIDMPANPGDDDHVPLSMAAGASLGSLVAMVVGYVWIRSRYAVSAEHVGFTVRKLPKHLFLGLLVGLATLPVVWVLMVVVSLGMETEYSHPLIDQMTAEGSLPAYLMGAVTAALIAPLVEEFLFRVILQGWLQSIPFKSLWDTVIGGSSTEQALTPILIGDGPSEAGIETLPAERAVEDNPYAVTTGAAASFELVRVDAESVSTTVPPIWPSVLTGILFGLAHWGYGLSFIPLIVLGIILGLVYRATHSIWPCVLIHFMFNGTSMAMLGVVLLQNEAAN